MSLRTMPRTQPSTIIKPQEPRKKRGVSLIVAVGGSIAAGFMFALVGVTLARNTLLSSSDSVIVNQHTPPADTAANQDTQTPQRGSLSDQHNTHPSSSDLLRNVSDRIATRNPPEAEHGTNQPVRSTFPPDSWTARYAVEFGIEPTRSAVAQSLRQHPEHVEQFIQKHADAPLPIVPEDVINRTHATGKDAIVEYLSRVSINHNQELNVVEKSGIINAFSTFSRPIPSAADLDMILLTLGTNVQILEAVPVPPEAEEVHQKYIAATRALFLYAEDLRNYFHDPVGALIAAARIDTLDHTFAEIASLINELEMRYNLT